MKKITKLAMALIVALTSLWGVNSALAADAKFSIINSSVQEKSDYVVASIESSGLTVTNHVVFHYVGDYVIFNLIVKNNSLYTREIVSITDDNSSSDISYSYEDHVGEKITAGSSFSLQIKMTCLNASDMASSRDINNRVILTIAFSEDESSYVRTEEIDLVVPNTGFFSATEGFSTSSFMITAIVLIGASVAIILVAKKRSKVATMVLVATFTLTAFSPLIVKADDNVSPVSFESTVSLRDEINIHWLEFLDGDMDNPEYEDYSTYDFDELLADYPTVGLYSESWDTEYYPGYRLVKATDGIGGPEITADTPILDDMEMVFYYELAEYHITYHLGDDTLTTTNPTTCTANSEINLSIPSRDGFRFDGWSSDQIIIDFDNTIYGCMEDLDIYANWSQPVTNINYYMNGYGNDDTVTVPYASEHRAAAAPQVDHYTFLGWDTEYDGTGTRYATGEVIKAANTAVDDIDLYAQWEITEYEITYVLNGGIVASSNPQTYNIESVFTLNNPTRDGKIFLGWTSNYNSTPSRNVSLNNEAYGPITFTANWADPVLDITHFEYMQDVSILNCLSTDINVSTTMKDRRNNKQYNVKRLKDGNCWMTENLDLYNIEISSDDSDLPNGMTYTIPDSTTSVYSFNNRDEYVGLFPEDEVYADTTYGVYYTYPAATALWDPVVGADSPQSICPKNWKLPTGAGEESEFGMLQKAYPTVDEMLDENGPHFTKNGLRAGSNTSLPGEDGAYWSSTTNNSTSGRLIRNRYYLGITTRNISGTMTTRISIGTIDRKFGSAIRCLIR